MATISTGLLSESNFLNLKGIDLSDVRKEVFDLLVQGEEAVCAFKTVRDQVVFTTKRIFVVNVQGLTGKKVSYISYPYAKVQYFGVETAGLLDIDSELTLAFSNGATLNFDFKSNVDIRELSTLIAGFVL